MKYFVFSFLWVLLWVGGLLGQNTKHQMLLADAIYFAPGKSELQNQYMDRLKNAARLLQENPESYAMIHAHTDSIGSYKDNEALAQSRAFSTIRYLNGMGIDTSRLMIRSLGEYSPLEDDGTEEGRAKNRCVTFYVMMPFDPSKWSVRSLIKGSIKDAKTGIPLIGRVLINHLDGRDTVYTNDMGEYEAELFLESYVEVRAYVKGYFFVSKVVKTQRQQTHTTDFNLERAMVGGKMLFDNLYFMSSSAVLLPSSAKALEAILTFLQENPDLKIEIGGHINKPNTPPVLESSESFKLSHNRAKTVYDYLVNQGISSERLSYKGYGNWEMINPTAITELQQQMNRRVELKVLE